MEQILIDLRPLAMLSTVIYACIGMALFGGALFVIQKVTPFSIRKEIEDDQNIALGIILGAVVIGLSIIIAASIHG